MERVLFLDWNNATCGPIAQAFLQLYGEDQYASICAGIEPTGLHPMAIEAMGDVDIHIEDHGPTALADVTNTQFDVVITLCDAALPALDQLHYTEHYHWPADDPATANGDYATRLTAFHMVRDILWHHVREWVYDRHDAVN